MTPHIYTQIKIIASCFRRMHAGQYLRHTCTPCVQGSTKASGACTPMVKPPTRHGEAFTPRVFASTASKGTCTLRSIFPTGLKGTCTLMVMLPIRAGGSCNLVAKLEIMLMADHCPSLESPKENREDKSSACNMLNKPMEPHALCIINHKYLFLL